MSPYCTINFGPLSSAIFHRVSRSLLRAADYFCGVEEEDMVDLLTVDGRRERDGGQIVKVIGEAGEDFRGNLSAL